LIGGRHDQLYLRIHYWREGSGAPLLLLEDAADPIADLDQALAAV